MSELRRQARTPYVLCHGLKIADSPHSRPYLGLKKEGHLKKEIEEMEKAERSEEEPSHKEKKENEEKLMEKFFSVF